MYTLRKNSSQFSNKHLVITGASRGIGAETAKRFIALGAKVSLLGLEPQVLAELADQLGENAFPIGVDVTDKAALQTAMKAAYDRFGDIHTLIANAGIYNVSSLLDDDIGAFEKTMDVNLFGVYNTIKSGAPYMKKGDGYILTVSSMAALANGPLMGAYAASKAAVEALTNALRVELVNDGVGVGCAYFGAIDTDLVQGGKLHPALSKLEAIAPDLIKKPIPVSEAVNAIVKGVSEKSHRLWAPKWLGVFVYLRGVTQPVMEWRVARSNNLREAMLIQKDKKRLSMFSDIVGGVSTARKNKAVEIEND